ncbi:hypothetical protein EEB14_51645 [Rhodococcus sp. WS4]|nr:hypothetical protein EEB14_51645 [Rhodococcus sp. WS4]
MREFAELFSRLPEDSAERGAPEDQPFLLGPRGEYDVALNRYFSVWLAPSPWNTQVAHARDLRTFVSFLWSARDGRGWRDATEDDRAAYEWWRRRDERGPRVQDSTWDREVARSISSTCGLEQDLVRANPIRQREAALWSPWSGRGEGGGARQVPAGIVRSLELH